MVDELHPGILNKTLGELLQNNSQAQGMVMQAMQISPQQFQELLNMTGDNKLMNMTIGDLFKNGIVQKATGQSLLHLPSQSDGGQAAQVSPQQFQQIAGVLQNGQPVLQVTEGQVIQIVQNDNQEDSGKQSFLQKVRNLFK